MHGIKLSSCWELRRLQEFSGKKKNKNPKSVSVRKINAKRGIFHRWLLPTLSIHGGGCAGTDALWSQLILTLYLHLEVIRQQFVLAVAKGEGEKRQQERVQDADNGQDVSPAHRAVPQAVLVRPLPAHRLHLWRVPAVRVDHAAHHHQRGCGGRTRAVSLAVISPCVLLLCRTITVEAFPRSLCQLRLHLPF